MSHYALVAKLVRFAGTYDWAVLRDLLENEDKDDLTDVIGFMLGSLFAEFKPEKKAKVIAHLLQSVTNYEFERITNNPTQLALDFDSED